MKHLLFFTRLALYLLAIFIPRIHPAVVVPYDRIGLGFWFVLIPVEMLIAFYLAPPRLAFRNWLLLALGPVLIFVVFISGITMTALVYMAGAGIAFLFTVLIFKGKIIAAGILEQFFLAFLYYKLINFSRSSESAAAAGTGLTQIILVLLICTFLLYGLVLYLSVFHREREKRGPGEMILFLVLAVPAVLVITILLPPDFIRHAMVFNPINRDIKPEPFPLNERGEGLEGGNLRSDNDFGNEEGENGGEQEPGESSESGSSELEGIPADQWDRIVKGKGNKQYAVMVVSSKTDPLYAAGAYFGRFDGVKGFLFSQEETLNELSYRRFLETWEDTGATAERKRRPVDIFTLSTLAERFLPYRPFAIEPTVLNRKFHPFDFSFNTVSSLSSSQKQDWLDIKGLSETEREELKSFLEVPLPAAVQSSFENHLQQAVGDRTGYYERIEGILKSFAGYQYELGFDDTVHVTKMENFLLHLKRGDCTEFSNTTAILCRLAGIPSRVVTGYLVSRQLQTTVHRQGVYFLREVIESLQEFPLDQLVLVTTAHLHSWVQLYLPGYGWVDFETTDYALPPLAGGDLNALDVVIPLIQGETIGEERFRFPWKSLLIILLGVSAGMVIILYLYRYGREIYLRTLSKGQSLKALKALQTLFLIKLSVNGYDYKASSHTPLEYAARYPELYPFAVLYTVLRFRERFDPGEKELRWQQLRASYSRILEDCRRTGVKSRLRRLFSLRSLYYG